MGTVIIFALVSILAAFASLSALKNKNGLGSVFGILSFCIFGWFAVMTLIKSGFPAAH
nr:DUF2759 domain-containing protein [uncultured Bacillus sp.]